MDVITTHVNADFDCLGAMVAAKKLYPDALMVFSGAQEKTVRDFFLKSTGYALNFTRLKDIDLARIQRLILVDCQHSSRIGPFAEILAKPGLEVHIFDHHPSSTGDIRSSGGEIRDCGSSTTIIAKILMGKELTVTPTEATFMMLGIHEDTGNLTFPSTTADDYMAAAWLLRQGANLNTISDFLTQELTAEQISLLNDLLKSLVTRSINGIDISIAHAAVDYYIGDIAVLAHMMRDMENLDVVFIVVEMGPRVYVVARSRLSEVDVGSILRQLGGGGHATAASATVKNLTLIQVIEKLDEELTFRVKPTRAARDIMTSAVKTVLAATHIIEARDLLVRYNINAMPVMENGRMVGIISRRIVEKALFHRLGHLPVTEYMNTEFLQASPETPLSDIQQYIVGHNRRLVPVFEEDRLVGVVTRTDLLRYMYAGAHDKGAEPVYDLERESIKTRRREVAHLFSKNLPSRLQEVLKELGAVGDELDVPLYAVGGFVRDLLLGQENYDLDVTVEGDGILFAEAFCKKHKCRVRSHAKFGTAVIVFADGMKIDVASTRLEYYASPGALPTVERSSLKMDLYRRDFTINTLAIRLNKNQFGTLIDFFGAQHDLQEKAIRVLHNLSFVEDPTRVFRAIRFEQRLGFAIAKHTENLIKNAVKMNFLEKLKGKRLLAEIINILREREPFKAVHRLASFNLLQFIHPDLRLCERTIRVLDEMKKIISWYDLLYLEKKVERWVVYFLGLCQSLPEKDFWETCTRLAVSEHYKEKLADSRKQGEQILSLMERGAERLKERFPSEIHALLKGLPLEVLLYMMAKTASEEVRKAISFFITHLQDIHPVITGNDLKDLEIPMGPQYRKILDKVVEAKLNDPGMTKEDELQLARRLAREVS